MYLGIDVGGTHTDGALLGEELSLLETVKVPTRTGDVLGSLMEALRALMTDLDPGQIRRLTVSSTLGLNAVLTGRADQVGLMVTGGPGLEPDLSSFPLAVLLPGGQDHRGEVLAEPDLETVRRAAADLVGRGAAALAAAAKFGPKNDRLEEIMARGAALAAPDRPLTRASRLAGRLNLPRRLNTAWLNSSVIRLYGRFIDDLKTALNEMGLVRAEVNLLAADGGALSPAEAAESPVRALAAGPAAGLMGLWAMSGLAGDALMVDVGGTSTDLAVMADGEPLMTAEGLDIAGRPTLVRAFLTHSLALGGDSALKIRADGSAAVGPEREGPALALTPDDFGRRAPTLTDALNVLGLCQVGQTEISALALAQLPGGEPEKAAAQVLAAALAAIARAADELVHQVNNRPVYTLGALRLARPIRPLGAALLGGPAQALAHSLEKALKLPVTVPPMAAVANAVGAARSRPSIRAELYADTALGTVSIPGLGPSRAIGRGYHMAEAQAELLSALKEAGAGRGGIGPPQIIEAESFNQLSGYGRADKIFRLLAQTAPGVMS